MERATGRNHGQLTIHLQSKPFKKATLSVCYFTLLYKNKADSIASLVDIELTMTPNAICISSLMSNLLAHKLK